MIKTYRQAYQECNSKEELDKMVKHDILVAKWINEDRLPLIEKSYIEVCKEKGYIIE